LANHASALKRHRQSERRRVRNAAVKTSIKTVVRKLREAIAGGKADEAKEGLKAAVSMLDRAVTKGVLHRRNASRKISRLSSSVDAVRK
jgi:small subunit ribosomal protein S20